MQSEGGVVSENVELVWGESGFIDQWMWRIDLLVTDDRLSLRNNRLTFKTSGKILIILEEILQYTSIQ